MAAIAVAPTTVYFACGNSFQSYAGGVYSGNGCAAQTNHASECVCACWPALNAWALMRPYQHLVGFCHFHANESLGFEVLQVSLMCTGRM